MSARFPAWSPCTVALAAALLLGGGCQRAEEAPPAAPAATGSAAPLTAASEPDLIGIWTVVGHHLPGISAMSDVDAAAWHGRTVRLTAVQATSSDNHCDEPMYATRAVSKDSFLAEAFHLPPGRLAPLASLEHLTLLEVSCGGAPWTAMGGLLIGVDADRALAPWDGVFFELERDRDFRAAGQEPFWGLEIAKGKEIRFMQVGKPDVVTPVPRPATDRVTGARVLHAITEANDLHVVIEPTPCTDIMSGKPFETTVTVTLDQQTYHGCGGPLK